MEFLPRIELLTVCDEQLLGIRENIYLKYIGAQLIRHGLSLTRNTVVCDDAEEMKEAFLRSWSRSDIIITTGGLGAARINNIREVVAEVLGLELQFVPKVLENIDSDFQSIGRNMGKRFLRQCYKLEGSEIMPNNFGTAPGLWLEHQGKLLIMLPGLSSELNPMFDQEVIPRLQDKGLLKPSHGYLQLRTIGIDEENLEKLIAPTFERYPGLSINYCAYQGIIDIRLSPNIISYSWEELNKIGNECQVALGENFFAYGHETLVEGIFKQLRVMEKTLAVAESCTGGKLSDTFTNIPGSSKVFAGGIVCYNNEAKINLLDIPSTLIDQYGVVSAEVAEAMAIGVANKFSTSYALSVTGLIGPGQGTPENPVGTIYIGYYSPSGVCAHKVLYPGQREAVKVRTVNAAFDLMRRKLAQDKLADRLADCDLDFEGHLE